MDAAAFTPAYADIVASLPPHLARYCAAQDYAHYTAEQQRTWRYLMGRLVPFLARHAHPAYRRGLTASGIGRDAIPDIDVMNGRLAQLGWRVVAVDGFLPPSVFMEFQAARVLPVSVDMRAAEQVFYTPAPDIVHEAAGHAPLLVDPAYARFLQRIGEYGAKVLARDTDVDAYAAMRRLSDAAAAGADRQSLARARERVAEAERVQHAAPDSEAAALARLHWWTVEYGLYGDLETPRIYGAGLLSSIGEARRCLNPSTSRLPLSGRVVTDVYDITRVQPHYYVARDLEEVAETLDGIVADFAFRQSGWRAARALAEHGTLATARLSSGFEIVGKFTRALQDDAGELAFLETQGPTHVYQDGVPRCDDRADPAAHSHGVVLGRPKRVRELRPGEDVSLEYASGVKVDGRVRSAESRQGRPVLATLMDCTVIGPGEGLFHRHSGVCMLAFAEELTSAFGGAPDGRFSAYDR